MRIEAHNQLSDPVKLEVTRILVRDDFGNPIVLVVQKDLDRTVCYRAGDPDFIEQLRLYGIRDTVLVTNLDAKSLGQSNDGFRFG